MNIPPPSGPLGIPPAVPTPEETARTAGTAAGATPEVRRIEPVQSAAEARDVNEQGQTQSEMEQLRSLTERSQLELRLEALPDSNVTLIRIVEPRTGEVVREFPPENLAKELRELRRLAALRLDRMV